MSAHRAHNNSQEPRMCLWSPPPKKKKTVGFFCCRPKKTLLQHTHQKLKVSPRKNMFYLGKTRGFTSEKSGSPDMFSMFDAPTSLPSGPRSPRPGGKAEG